MKFDTIEKFIELAKNSGVSELKYEGDDIKLSVKIPYGGPTPLSQMSINAQEGQVQVAPLASVSQADNDLIEIPSPFVGTFYRASAPGARPFFEVGNKVKVGQVLCIVEAMKIMNEIESEVSGEIVEICVENETYVEFGQVLFKIKP